MTRLLGRLLVGMFAGALLLLLTAGAAAPSSASITATNYVIWGTGGVDPGHFYGARGIAVGPYGDLVYVADTGNNRIEAFTPEGIYLYKWGHFGKGSGDFDRPVAITTDPAGSVYVADNGNGLVQKFSEKGTFVLQWSVPGVIGVAADNAGHVYALSSFLNLVSKRSTSGVSEGSWQAFPLSTGFVDHAAQSIATDSSGNVYVGDNRTVHWAPCHDGWPAPPEHTTAIYKFTGAGSELAHDSADSNPGPRCIELMAATYHDEYLDGVGVNPSDGWIYVARPGFQETRRIPPSLQNIFGNRMQGPRYPSPVIPDLDAVAFDCRGNYYALSRADNVVVKYLNSGAAPIPCGERPPPPIIKIGDTRVEAKGVVVTIGCPAGHCKGTVTVTPSTPCPNCPFKLGRRGFDIPGGTAVKVTLPTDSKDRDAIKRKKRLPVIVTVVVGGKTVKQKDTLKSRSALSVTCPSAGVVGTAATVSGFLAPAHPGTTIRVILIPPTGTPALRKAKTSSAGRYELSVVPNETGSWTASAEWSGDADHEASSAGPCAFTVTGPAPNFPPPPPNAPPPPGGDQQPPPPPPPVQKDPSSIAINCPTSWQQNQPFSISGSINPPNANATVSLAYRSPQNVNTSRSVSTDGGGNYSDSGVAPNAAGTWTVSASWNGDATHSGSQTSCTIQVF